MGGKYQLCLEAEAAAIAVPYDYPLHISHSHKVEIKKEHAHRDENQQEKPLLDPLECTHHINERRNSNGTDSVPERDVG